MYLVTLRISSSCGLAAAAEESRGSVYSLQAIPVNDEANSVLSFMRISGKRDIQEVNRGLRKDFIKIIKHTYLIGDLPSLYDSEALEFLLPLRFEFLLPFFLFIPFFLHC